MDDTIWDAIKQGLTCDISTTGAKSGLPRRIEIWYFVVDEQVYITGTPGRRDWLANLQIKPELTFHVKEEASADLPARATIISDEQTRRRIMSQIMTNNSWFAEQQYKLDEWVQASPLVRVDF